MKNEEKKIDFLFWMGVVTLIANEIHRRVTRFSRNPNLFEAHQPQITERGLVRIILQKIKIVLLLLL